MRILMLQPDFSKLMALDDKDFYAQKWYISVEVQAYVSLLANAFLVTICVRSQVARLCLPAFLVRAHI